jgi:outer membrane immunogenic protein
MRITIRSAAIIGSAILGALLGTGAASAADMPLKAAPAAISPAYDWSGFFGGINGGGEWQHHDWAFHPPIPGAVNQSWRASTDGGTIGFHAGLQKQWGQLVLGVEGGANTFVDTPFARHRGYGVSFDTFADTRLESIYTAGARAGYAWENWLLYGTGGWATGYVSTRQIIILTGVEEFPSRTSLRQDGWYVGAGFEYMALRGQVADVILGIDYKHIDLGTGFHCNNIGISCLGVDPGSAIDVRTTSDVVTARLSFKFNPWQAPVAAKY